MKFSTLLLICPMIMAAQTNEVTNLALHRQAWASSAIDYNMTAHLVTDGINDSTKPMPLTVRTPGGRLPRREAEWTLDGNEWSSNVVMGDTTWIEYSYGTTEVLWFAGARKVKIDGRVAYDDTKATKGYRLAWQVSDDGQTWITVGEVHGDGLPGKALQYKLHSDPNKQEDSSMLPARVLDCEITSHLSPLTSKFSLFRLLLEMEGAAYWDLHDMHFYDEAGQELWMQSSQQFCSMWMSEGGGKQWLKVDLGRPCHIDSVVPHWYQEPLRWHTEVEDEGRTVCIVMEEPNESGYYAMRELETWGTASARPTLDPQPSTTFTWQLQRASEVYATGEEISSAYFTTDDWIPATVPGTVLTSYINIGAVPNPNYADWVDQISESFFRSNFWYRGIKTIYSHPSQGGAGGESNESVILCFDGINWKANVFFNGVKLGRIEGAFQRGQFDVTRLLRDGENYVAVEVICNEHFGSPKEKNENTTQFNGGILGADNPTFHASIGWDWITTVRGREVGIWNNVYLRRVPGGVALSDPYVETCLISKDKEGKRKKANSTHVSLRPAVFVKNISSNSFSGTLKGWIGNVTFQKHITLPANAEQEVTFSPQDFPQLTSPHFRLWWPNGYGQPYMYQAGYCLESDEQKANSEKLVYKAGLRQLTYEHINDSLLIYINGRRFVPLGGNWGFSEHNLQYKQRDYEAAVAYHKDMNCTMIRNWVGQTGHHEFYNVCDSLGILLWQDFWLANPADGPDPYDESMFLNNAEDYVRRIRQHAAIGLYCGRNEGYPPPNIDRKLRQFVSQLSPGIGYISSSADDGVTGHGPYCAQPPKVYFERQSGKIHTERGMPAVMNIESMQRTLSPDALWPQSVQWGQHDYTMLGAQRAQEFNSMVAKAMGKVNNAQPNSQFSPLTSQLNSFTRWAQLINYNGYRAMFESGSKTRSGLLIWMSHPCWPTMVWQTYDYYFDTTAAYFGVKKACEPLHIQLNALTDSIEVVNLFAGDHRGLTATATLYDVPSASKLWAKTAKINSHDDSTVGVHALNKACEHEGFEECASGDSSAKLLRLELNDKRGLVSLNDYYLEDSGGTLADIAALPPPQLSQRTVVTPTANGYRAEVTLSNTGKTIAPFLRLNLKNADGMQILPAVYSDNYFNLLPGERRTVTITWKRSDGDTAKPVIEITPLN